MALEVLDSSLMPPVVIREVCGCLHKEEYCTRTCKGSGALQEVRYVRTTSTYKLGCSDISLLFQ